MKSSSPLKLLMLQCSLQLFTITRAGFSFTITIFAHSTSGECDLFDTACETFFPRFCLRPPRNFRSTDDSDCPLGENTDDLRSSSGTRTIISNSLPWPGGFQLFFEALDDDGGFSSADHLGDIFVDRTLAVGVATVLQEFTGGRVTVQLSFSVECLDDFYGDDCSVFCQPQSNDLLGYYTCNEDDGSRDCLPDYYGANCLTFCQDSNDPTNGFYTCNEEDGSIICNDGFREPQTFCTENIDDCAESPCENGGMCRDLVDDFTCTCPPGYTGEVCSDDINECLEVICPGNSSCVQDAPASFQCQCNHGFEGENCTEIEPCESVTCDNGGTCVSEDPFSQECHCPPGFNGTYCENDIDECLLVECENGGTCVADEPSTFECVCPEDYGGLRCELDVDECLLEEVCPMGLFCVNDEPGFRCLAQDSESQQTESRMMVIFIGAGVGSVVIVVILILIVVVIILLTRRRAKSYRADRSHSHIYHAGPSMPDQVKSVSLSPASGKVQQSDNPLYGTQTMDPFPASPDLRTFENNLYDAANPNPDTVIYDQVRTSVLKLATFDSSDCDVAVSPNVAYQSVLSPHRTEAISNPVYATSGGNEVSSSQPPTYSVPKPATAAANGKLREIDGYTVLRDAGSENSSVPPPTSDTPGPGANGGLKEEDGYAILNARGNAGYAVPRPSPKPSPADYESIELRSKAPTPKHTASAIPPPKESSFGTDNTELTYAEPATKRSASRKDKRYNTLQHTKSPPPPSTVPEQPAVRLAAMPDSGYTKLETES